MLDNSQDKLERESRIGQLLLQVRDTEAEDIGDNANVVPMKTLECEFVLKVKDVRKTSVRRRCCCYRS
jgi:hypothetical protein